MSKCEQTLLIAIFVYIYIFDCSFSSFIFSGVSLVILQIRLISKPFSSIDFIVFSIPSLIPDSLASVVQNFYQA